MRTYNFGARVSNLTKLFHMAEPKIITQQMQLDVERLLQQRCRSVYPTPSAIYNDDDDDITVIVIIIVTWTTRTNRRSTALVAYLNLRLLTGLPSNNSISSISSMMLSIDVSMIDGWGLSATSSAGLAVELASRHHRICGSTSHSQDR